jgi:predicted NodU family carbamoyl transferase
MKNVVLTLIPPTRFEEKLFLPPVVTDDGLALALDWESRSQTTGSSRQEPRLLSIAGSR